MEDNMGLIVAYSKKVSRYYMHVCKDSELDNKVLEYAHSGLDFRIIDIMKRGKFDPDAWKRQIEEWNSGRSCEDAVNYN
ncbi:hypothetical protein GF336_00475 [Candidatus Woesearchaeota archaeon]|nr:hypothetical protein [Candidatus Woesearchaeota archaeon]